MYFQIRSHSKVLGFRASTYLFLGGGAGGHNSTHNIRLNNFLYEVLISDVVSIFLTRPWLKVCIYFQPFSWVSRTLSICKMFNSGDLKKIFHWYFFSVLFSVLSLALLLFGSWPPKLTFYLFSPIFQLFLYFMKGLLYFNFHSSIVFLLLLCSNFQELFFLILIVPYSFFSICFALLY